ncbi:MAG: hypothetical protein WC917_00405 [Bacilli bacterium]|jgi:chaperonin GroES
MGIYQQDYMQHISTNDVGYEYKKADLELLKKYSQEVNIADQLDEDFLKQLGIDLEKQVSADDNTRQEWMDKYNEALDLARQHMTPKVYPFENASNVKIPLILSGCVQFSARIMPEMIQNNKTVYVAISGQATLDEESSAERLSNHMSLQTMKTVENWASDTDKLLIALPLVGTVFRKWSYDPITRKPCAFLCLPTEIIVANDVSSLEKAERITHVIRMSRNEVIERIKFGIFSDDCLNDLPLEDDDENIVADNNYSSDDEDKELPSNTLESRDNYILWEVGCYLDLDNDGYCEPYTVTLMRKTKRICRIAARFDERDFVLNSKGELVRINPTNYYTAHHFLPSPDGTFLGMGFGQILLPLSKAINSVTNQLIDAGTLSNLQGGFLSKDLRLRKGEMQFSAGEWKVVNFNVGMGTLSNHIYPLPFKEPSQTLMALLNFLVDFGKQTANISDVLMGNPVNANMPATSVVSLIEQGSKVFSSILTRLYESFKKEYNVLFNLNKKYLSLYPDKDLMTAAGFITMQDYSNDKFNIYPIANPAMGMDAVRLAKMQVLMQMQTPLINQPEVIKRYLIALGMTEPEKLMAPKEQLQQPSPQDQLIMAQIAELQAKTHEIEMRTSKIMVDNEETAINIELNERKVQVDAAYKSGMLAIGKANAVAAITAAESRANAQDVKTAENVVDTEVSKSPINADMSNIDQQLGTVLQQNQQGGNMQQNQGVAGQQASGQPGQQTPGTSVQNAPNLPPELDQMLQQVAAKQQSK